MAPTALVVGPWDSDVKVPNPTHRGLSWEGLSPNFFFGFEETPSSGKRTL